MKIDNVYPHPAISLSFCSGIRKFSYCIAFISSVNFSFDVFLHFVKFLPTLYSLFYGFWWLPCFHLFQFQPNVFLITKYHSLCLLYLLIFPFLFLDSWFYLFSPHGSIILVFFALPNRLWQALVWILRVKLVSNKGW